MTGLMHADFGGFGYCGFKILKYKVKRGPLLTLAQGFIRNLEDGLVWGLGVAQIGGRHLFYIGAENGAPRICLGYLWLTKGRM